MNVDSLSAMLDGELRRPELDRLLRQLEQNPALREELSRLVLAREALRGTQVLKADLGFADRVMAALPDQPDAKVVPLRPAAPVAAQPAPARWRPIAAGLAAAAVGGAAVLALRPEPAAEAVPPAAMPAVMEVSTAAAATSRVVDLREYLLAHSQSRARHGVGGTLGYARYAAHAADLPAAESAP